MTTDNKKGGSNNIAFFILIVAIAGALHLLKVIRENRKNRKIRHKAAWAATEKAAREKAAREKAAREKAARVKATREIAAQEKVATEKAARANATLEKAALKVIRLRQCGRRLTLEKELSSGQLYTQTAPLLANVFFSKHKRTLRSINIVRKIASFASVPQTFRLLLACKEMLATEKKIFQGHQLPTVCDMTTSNSLKMCHLMVKTPNSRWLNWLYTSKVKELKLPKEVMTDEEMLIMFGCDLER